MTDEEKEKKLYRVTAVLLVEADNAEQAREAVLADAPNFVFAHPSEVGHDEDGLVLPVDVECFGCEVLAVAQTDREEDLALVQKAKDINGVDDDEDDNEDEDEDDDFDEDDDE